LLVLAENLNEPLISQKIEGTFFMMVPMKSGDLTKPLKAFLATILCEDDDSLLTTTVDKDLPLPERKQCYSSPLTLLLKALSLDLLEPAEERLRQCLAGLTTNYKRKAQLGVSIMFAPYCITLEHRQRSVCSDREHSVELEWKLSLSFDSAMRSITRASVTVSQLHFPLGVDEIWRSRIMAALVPISEHRATTNHTLSPSTSMVNLTAAMSSSSSSSSMTTSSNATVSVASLLESLQHTIAQLSIKRSTAIVVHNDELPHAVCATQLLATIREALVDSDKIQIPIAMLEPAFSSTLGSSLGSSIGSTTSSLASSQSSHTILRR
jgi:hypothetical protein